MSGDKIKRQGDGPDPAGGHGLVGAKASSATPSGGEPDAFSTLRQRPAILPSADAAAHARDRIERYLVDLLGEEEAGEILFAEPFDRAIIGVSEGHQARWCIVYDLYRVKAILEEDMEEEDAMEWIGYNTLGSWAGSGTPVYIWLERDADRLG